MIDEERRAIFSFFSFFFPHTKTDLANYFRHSYNEDGQKHLRKPNAAKSNP